jgi:hypothetical protein
MRSTSDCGMAASAAFMLAKEVSPPSAGISSEYSMEASGGCGA